MEVRWGKLGYGRCCEKIFFYKLLRESRVTVVTETELYRRAVATYCCLIRGGWVMRMKGKKKNNNKNEETLSKADFVFQNE